MNGGFRYRSTHPTLAVDNCLGPNGGEYLHIPVQKNRYYELIITNNDAIFNTNDNAEMVNVGVMYVEPPRKMTTTENANSNN
jgi:hypothetical protein